MLLSRSVIFSRLLHSSRDLAVCSFRTVPVFLSKPSKSVPSKIFIMAPRKGSKAANAKALKVENVQPELPEDLPKNDNKDVEDSDVEEAVVVPVVKKEKPRQAGKKANIVKDQNDVEEKKSSKRRKNEVASENGNGVHVDAEEEMTPEEVEEKEEKPKRAARKPRGKVEEKKPPKRGRGKAFEDVVEEEEGEDEQPAPKKGKKAKAAVSKKLPKKATKTPRDVEDENAEESDHSAEKEEEQPKKGRNVKVVKRGKKTSKEEEKEEKGKEESDHSEEEKDIKEEEQPAAKKGRKVKAAASKKSSKKAVKEEDSGDEEESDHSAEPAKKAPTRKGAKRATASKKDDDSEKAGPSKKSKPNPTVTDWDTVNFECTRENSLGKTSNFRITSWNVDGIRAWIKKGGLDIIQKANPDILVLQETKCSVEKLPEEIQKVEGYKMYWCASNKEGYAGVGIMTKMMPIDVFYGIENDEQDADGRCITAEFKKFYLVNVYVPNAGRQLVTLPKRLEWNKAFKTYVKKLDEKKPVIICGDLNVAHNEIDLANPKTNKKNAGFTQEERDGMTDFLNAGFVDTFRKLYPDQEKAYTFWTYMMNARAKNTGWRLDYFLLSERFVKDMCDNVIHSNALGSDHCPITLYMNI